MEKLLKATPLLTAILIFIGYWNLHFYYKYLGIQIYDFINTGEVIVSFFPIALDIFIWCGIYLLFMGLSSLAYTEEDVIKNRNELKYKNQIKYLFNKENYYKKKKFFVHIFLNISSTLPVVLP